MRASRFYQSHFPSSSSSATRLHCERRSSVGTAGPQLRAPDLTGHFAMSRGCGVHVPSSGGCGVALGPVTHRELRGCGVALGPNTCQRDRQRDCQRDCQIDCHIEYQNRCQIEARKLSEDMPDRIADRMSE